MRIVFTVSLIAALAALSLAACQSDQAKLEQHMTRGDAYFEEEKFSEAIIEYKSVLQIDPNRADAHYGLAKAYLQNQQPREGFWELRETVRLDPSNLDARVEFGAMSLRAGEAEEALAQAEAVIEAEAGRVPAHLLRARAYEALKKPNKALDAYEEATKVNPESEDHSAALTLYANFLHRNGDREAAEPVFRKLVEHDPSFASYSALALFLAMDRDRSDEAERAYQKALEVASAEERARGHAQLAGFFYSRERWEEAVATLEQGIEEQEDPVDLIYLLARFYNARGENAKADALVEQATRERPDDPVVFMTLSTYRGRRGDLEGALAAVAKAFELDPENPDVQLRKAELLVDTGFRDGNAEKVLEGRGIVDEMLAKDPAHPGALVVKAKIDLAQKKARPAINSLNAALDARPDWAQAHFLLGMALYFEGDLPAARTELARALELDAGLVEARKILAQVHAGLGEYEYAIEEARRFLRERPGDTRIRILVAQSLVNLGRRDEAVAELEGIPEEDRGAEVEYALGRSYMSLGQFDKARTQLEAADAARPGTYDVLNSLLLLDRRENRFEESVKRIAAALESKPDSGKLHQLQGVVAQISGRPADAEASFQKAVELDPEDLSGYERLATFYAQTGRLQEAIDTYEKAVQVRPEQAQLHHLLGVLYEHGGELDRAVERYEEAIRRAPNLGEAKNNLAYIYAERGKNLDRALDLAQEAKALLPDNPNTADTLGWVLYKRGVPSAAISFLKEAEAGSSPGDSAAGVIRYHLALAYEANDQRQEAKDTLERSLAELATQIEAAQAQNVPVASEPAWATDARAMLERLSRDAAKSES